MIFVLYKKKNAKLSTPEIKKIETDLANIFQQKHQCKIKLTIKDQAERIGYKSGKLTYFL
jgi:hypothetical protein